MPVSEPPTIPPPRRAEFPPPESGRSGPVSTGEPVAPQPALRHGSMMRQIVDSLVSLAVAVIVFRAFVLEGYIISTGSMAPCLLGYHKRVECPDCHYRFQFGVAFDQPVPSSEVASCPNCGQRAIDVSQVPRNSGDQLLVFKAAFPLREPKRWEIVVFQNPANPMQAYVKRLIGLPGEALQILDGDVFVDGVRQTKTLETQRSMRISVFDNNFHASSTDWVPHWIATGQWSVRGDQFHTDAADHFEWVNYYHWPRISPTELQQVPGGTSELRPALLTDTYGYNRAGSGGTPERVHDLMLAAKLKFDDSNGRFVAAIPHRGRLAVCQIDARQPRLDVWVTASTGTALDEALSGRLAPVASKLIDRELFAAAVEFEFSTFDNQVTIGLNEAEELQVSIESPSQPTVSDEQSLAAELESESGSDAMVYPEATIAGRRRRTSRDDLRPASQTTTSSLGATELRVTDSGEVAPSGVTESSIDDSDSQNTSLSPARFAALGGSLNVSNLRLFRDVHYTSEDYQHATQEPLPIGDDEFFFLGDNSPVSLDSRAWDSPVVSRELLIGRPMFVHLPSRPGRLRIGDRVNYFRLPDFSRMRWIR